MAVVDGVRLAYRSRGLGEPVVFLHGTPSHSFIWRKVLPSVEEEGYRVVAYDLLGYGRSERPVDRDTSVAGQAVLLDRLLTHLHIDEFNLVGHDIGGAIAQIFATRQPHRLKRLMLIDTVSYDSWPSETWERIIRERLDDSAAMPMEEFEALLTRQLRMAVADPARMSGDVLEAYLLPHRTRLGLVSFFEHQVRHYDSAYTQEIAPALGTLTMPVRILWGAEDQWQPASYGRRLAGDISTAELTIVPEAGHFLMEDNDDRVVAEILDFLAEAPADE
ncbi:MAG: alpha/beta hydrolase [Actinomycetota bacterium]|nr:alpha/beta hydrolase [Actinomycetota bacterium]